MIRRIMIAILCVMILAGSGGSSMLWGQSNIDCLQEQLQLEVYFTNMK